MKPSRRSRPFLLDALEPRLVLSQAATVSPVLLAAEVSAQNSASSSFPLNEKLTLKLGIPVEDSITTKLSDGTTQTETRLIVPNLDNKTETITESITLPGGAGVETVTDVSSTTGNVTTEAETTVNPNGTTTFAAITDIRGASGTVVRESENPPSGGPIVISGTILQSGSTTVTREKTTDADGGISRSEVIDVMHGSTSETTKTKITPEFGPSTSTTSESTIVRLQPPGT